ncbi:unnamed protein product [Closterium sp. Naga37s-1]|nr:unnamed protein product [Closterium sp. Naga37s-1]
MAPVAPRAAPHNPPQSAPQRALQLDQQSTMDLTLTVLQRMDPAVAEILLTVGHVTVYEFDVAASSWVRAWHGLQPDRGPAGGPRVRGAAALHPVPQQRAGDNLIEDLLGDLEYEVQPPYILYRNRGQEENGTHPLQCPCNPPHPSPFPPSDNLIEDLLGDLEYEVQPPYILYRNRGQEVNGIWFYSLKECHDAANLFSRILNTFSRHAHPTKPLIPSNRAVGGALSSHGGRPFGGALPTRGRPAQQPRSTASHPPRPQTHFSFFLLSPIPISPEYSELEAPRVFRAGSFPSAPSLPSASAAAVAAAATAAAGPAALPAPPLAALPPPFPLISPAALSSSSVPIFPSAAASPRSAFSPPAPSSAPFPPLSTSLLFPPHPNSAPMPPLPSSATACHLLESESAETKGPIKSHGEGRAAAAAAARDEAGNGISATETGRRGEGVATKERGSEGEEGGEGESERMSGSESERMSRALAALLQPSHGAPMLQPFPPPAPPPSLASPAPPPVLSPSIPAPPHSIPASSRTIPAPISPAVGGTGLGSQGGRGGEGVAVVVTREGLKAALLRLVQVGSGAGGKWCRWELVQVSW